MRPLVLGVAAIGLAGCALLGSTAAGRDAVVLRSPHLHQGPENEPPPRDTTRIVRFSCPPTPMVARGQRGNRLDERLAAQGEGRLVVEVLHAESELRALGTAVEIGEGTPEEFEALQSALTDSLGVISFEVPGGLYDLFLWRMGYSGDVARVRVRAGWTDSVVVSLGENWMCE